MADDRPQPVDQSVGTKTPADHDETNWGEDWESAFQAEDDTFFSSEKDEDFFLEENAPAVTDGAASQKLDSSLEKTLSGIPDQGAVTGAQPAQYRIVFEALTALFLSGKSVAQKQFTRLQAFPLFVRIPLYALPFLLVGILFALSGTSTPPQTLPQTAKQPGIATVSSDRGTNATGIEGLGRASQLHPGKFKKKWAFPAFIIPVNNPASDQPVTFVLVDITLIAFLDDQEEPPADKKIFVRDIIYQFFQNKPLEELRRFSLARGEMNKELRAWLLKQWPEAPIESIIFNQYHLS